MGHGHINIYIKRESHFNKESRRAGALRWQLENGSVTRSLRPGIWKTKKIYDITIEMSYIYIHLYIYIYKYVHTDIGYWLLVISHIWACSGHCNFCLRQLGLSCPARADRTESFEKVVPSLWTPPTVRRSHCRLATQRSTFSPICPESRLLGFGDHFIF